MLALIATIVTLTATPADAPTDTISYQVVSGRDAAIHIAMPYTFGTHELVARSIRGQMKVRAGSMAFVSGGFSVPISAIESDNRTLGCHMRESLGLDYTKSRFPRDHVCADGQLPQSGNDSIAFPEISFQVTDARFVDDASKLLARAAARIEVRGRWTIHGIVREQTIALMATPTGGPQRPTAALKLTGRATIHLATYGIQVKPALVIHAGEDATVDLTLLLEERR